MQRQQMTKKQLGTLCVFIAAVLYSLGGLCIKVIPWNGLSINSARNIVALVVVGGYLALTRHKLRFNRWIALGALSVCGTNVLFSVANKLTPPPTPLYCSSLRPFSSSCWECCSGSASRRSWI